MLVLADVLVSGAQLDNILLHMDPASPGAPVIKLCDFGFSKNERNSLSKTSCGTPEYIAPEVRCLLPRSPSQLCHHGPPL